MDEFVQPDAKTLLLSLQAHHAYGWVWDSLIKMGLQAPPLNLDEMIVRFFL